MSQKTATLYRMALPDHLCPSGQKARWTLQRAGYAIDDHLLTDRAEVEAFKAKHGVKTTPQAWIAGERIGGYTELRAHFGHPVRDRDAVTYRPVLAIFAVAALMALGLSWAMFGTLLSARAVQMFVSISMCFLAVQKLQDVERFSTMFLTYDLLARRWVPYGYIYPYAEALAGILMLAGALIWLAAPLALVIGLIGSVSVVKAVYIDGRELKCACVGGGSNVPLGFVSLTENVAMVVMGAWMLLG